MQNIRSWLGAMLEKDNAETRSAEVRREEGSVKVGTPSVTIERVRKPLKRNDLMGSRCGKEWARV